MENFVTKVNKKPNQKWSQFGLLLSPFGILLIFSALWSFAVKPWAIGFILDQIPKLNSEQSFVDLSVSDVDLSILKLQLSAGRIETKFKNELKDLAPLQVKRVRVQLDPFRLLVGQLLVSKVQIDQVIWAYENKKLSDSKLEVLPLDEIFQVLPKVPVAQLIVYNSEFRFSDKKLGLDLTFQIPQLNLQNRKTDFAVVVKKLNVRPTDPSQAHVQADLDLTAVLNYSKENSTLVVPDLAIHSLNSMIKLNGKMSHFKNVITKPEGSIELSHEIHFDDVRTIALSLFPQKSRFPSITGVVKSSGELQFTSLEDVNGHFALETKQVSIDHFTLGQAQVKAEIKKNQILINRIDVEHPSTSLTLKEVEIEQKPPYRFKTSLQAKQFDLQKLFISIGLTDVPAGLIANANAHCQGAIEPEFKVNCDANANVQDVWVKPSLKDSMHIVKLNKAELNGQVQIDQRAVSYKSAIKLGESVGSSDGQISYTEGFKINYETEKLNFSDVESLADLNFKGDLKIKGNTSGDSSHGLIDADFIFSNGEIDKFKLGKVESKLHYEKANLNFKQSKGILGRTNYQGDVVFDFNKSTITAGIDLKELYGEDVLTALKERFDIAFNFSGRGQGHIDLTGPLDFWKLKYILKAQLNQGQIADEGFDQLQLHLVADGDQIRFEQAFAKKYKSRLNVSGYIDTTKKEPQFVLQMNAKPLHIDELDHVIRLAPHLAGQTWIEGKVSGPIEFPEVSFNFSAKQISFENIDYPGSQGFISIDRSNFKFNGQLFGRQVQSDVIWPWNENNPYSLRLQVRDLNPLMLLPLISIPQPTSEFYSRLNADIDLKSNRRTLKNSEGTVKISDFMLQRGAFYLKLYRPSTMIFKNGLSQMDPIDLKGETNSVQIGMVNSNYRGETKVSLAGDIQLRLFQFMVPFAQSVSGRLQLDSQVLFRENDFELLGDGEITDGVVGLKSFPQPIENINTPIEFSKSKILLNDITAQLGPHEISGQGQIDIKGPKNVVVNLQASADQIEITFPEQITTAGKAELAFFGNWLPYTLKVNYKVARGLVEKNFGQDSSQSKSSVRASPYLPPQQIEQQTPSLMLDVAVDLTQGIIVKNQLLEGEASGKLNISGTPESPIIAGQIDIRAGSKLIFKDKPFDIQTATIKFPGTVEINPDVYMTANARVSDYDINLLVQGVPSKNLVIKPTSQPPLSEPDIFSLLALGMTSTKMDQNLSSKTQQDQTGLEVISAGINGSQINKKFQEKFGLTVQLAPSVDSTKNIAVPKVVVSKKIQKNVNASYSRPLTGDTQTQEWKLQYLFNPNKSLILNYQNTESSQQDQITNPNNNDQGILGLDFEYKKEFK